MIKTRIVRIDDEVVDHLTITTTTAPLYQFLIIQIN